MNHKVFVSYHHQNDWYYRDEFETIFSNVIISKSVQDGDIDPNLSDDSKECEQFRGELTDLQKSLTIYTQMLGQMAGVEEDLTKLEAE